MTLLELLPFPIHLKDIHLAGKLLVHVHVTSQPYVHILHLLFLQAEKFKLATTITMKLASLVTETSKSELAACYELLEKIAVHWEAGTSISSNSIFGTHWIPCIC